MHGRSICKVRLKRLLQFLAGLLHFRCDRTSTSYVQAHDRSLFARYVANRRRDCRRRQDILERGNEINGARTIWMHGTTAKFRDSVMRWEPFEARPLRSQRIRGITCRQFRRTSIHKLWGQTSTCANYARTYARVRISVLSRSCITPTDINTRKGRIMKDLEKCEVPAGASGFYFFVHCRCSLC